jgi:hypothetical protein
MAHPRACVGAPCSNETGLRGQKPRLGQKTAIGTRVGARTTRKAKLRLGLRAIANVGRIEWGSLTGQRGF